MQAFEDQNGQFTNPAWHAREPSSPTHNRRLRDCGDDVSAPGFTAGAAISLNNYKDSPMLTDDMHHAWERYASAWATVDNAERRRILDSVLAPAFVYSDPRITCRGPEEMAGNLDAFQQRQPGGSFVVRGILTHHDFAMLTWQLIKGDGEAATLGYDFIRFADEGRIAQITGFFAPPKP